MRRVAIIGMGLIGGSIALALKRSNIADIEIAGAARSRETMMKAKRMGAVDIDARIPEEAARGASLVIIAVPVLTTKQIFEDIAPVLAEGAIVTDAGSTKTQVARWANELLPEHAHFVGGHPMAGKEQSGVEAADADLFRGKPWVVTPGANAPEAAIMTVVGLAQHCGAVPVFMDPEEHDSYVAAISHLPLVAATALFSMAFGSQAWPELAGLASSGFRDTTRLASGSPEMARDIMASNRDNVIHWLDRYQAELSRLREAVASGDEHAVLDAFGRAQMERDNFMLNGPPRRPSGEPMPAISLGDMLWGSRIGEMLRKSDDIIRESEKRAEGKRR